MKHKKILIIILVLAVIAVLVSAAMKKTSLFFNGDKTELKIEIESHYTLQFPFSVNTNSIRTQHQ